MSDTPNIKASCDKETLDAIDFRLWAVKWIIIIIIIILIVIGAVGAKTLGIVSYIGIKTWWIWLLVFFLITPAFFITIASTAANFSANTCSDSIMNGKTMDSSKKTTKPLNLQSFTPFFAAPFTQFRTMFKSI